MGRRFEDEPLYVWPTRTVWPSFGEQKGESSFSGSF